MSKSQPALICSLSCCLVTRRHAQSPSMSVSQRQVWSILKKPDYFENRRVGNGSGATFSGIQCQQTASACFCSFRVSETVFWLLEQLSGRLESFRLWPLYGQRWDRRRGRAAVITSYLSFDSNAWILFRSWRYRNSKRMQEVSK